LDKVQVNTMRSLWVWSILAVLALMVATAHAADDKKKDGKTGDAPTAEEIAALEQAHEAIGTVGKVDATNKSLVFHLEWQRLDVNANAAHRNNSNYQNLLRQEQQIARTQNPLQRAQQMQRLMQQMARMQNQQNQNFQTITEKADFELQGDSDTKVRMLQLPPRTDPATGKPQPYSFKEREDARSPDPSLTGYHADWTTLASGQTVKVVLGHHKAGDKGDTIPVKMIIIEPDPAPTAPMPDPKKDKK